MFSFYKIKIFRKVRGLYPSKIVICCMAGLLFSLFTACRSTSGAAVTDGPNAPEKTTHEVSENPLSEEDAAVPEMQTTPAPFEDQERYQRYIDRLDDALADSLSRQQNCSFYREEINTVYTFGSDMYGWLLAAYDEQSIFMMDWLMEVNTEEGKNYQRYRFYLLQDGSQYFTYQTSGQDIEEDVPDYLVNEDALRYYRLDYVYDDGSDLEEKRKMKEENWQEQFGRTISGETLEFWYMEGKLYTVDRQKELLTDVSETKAICISAFLQLQPYRIAAELNIDEAKAIQIAQLIPEGYCLLKDWDDIAAYDLNEDGSMDYVVALYPEDHPEEKRYADFSPYEHSSEYYASEFWLLLSDAEQGYLPIHLTYSIEYPREDTLYLTDISFVGEGILRLEYFIGRSPWRTAVLLFEPNLSKSNGAFFYLLRSYYRELFGEIQIGDKESYGNLDMEIYYYGNFHYNEHSSSGTSDAPLNSDNTLDYSNVRYRCHDIWKEGMLNSHIWQRESDIVEAAQERFAGEFQLRTEPVFWNSRIVSYETELNVWHGTRLESKEEEEPRLWRVSIPIMLDRDTGDFLHVTDFIAEEDFLELFRRYAHKGNATHQSLTEEERVQCMTILEEGWEKADSLDSLTAFDWKEISLQITQQGVVVGLRTDLKYGTSGLTKYQIDKEHFMGTGLWYYLAPEWMQ